MRVLIVEDQEEVRHLVELVLSQRSIESVAVPDCRGAFEALAREGSERFDAILLDVSMPDGSGWDLLRALRAQGRLTPVLFLTGQDTPEARVRGLELGADDYITKPFETRELIARLEAVVRRTMALPVVEYAGLRIDYARHEVERDGRRVQLSQQEFRLLGELVRAGGMPVSKEHLLLRVWGLDRDPGTNVVQVQVARLRRKLDRSGPPLVRTQVGAGYRLVEPEPAITPARAEAAGE